MQAAGMFDAKQAFNEVEKPILEGKNGESSGENKEGGEGEGGGSVGSRGSRSGSRGSRGSRSSRSSRGSRSNGSNRTSGGRRSLGGSGGRRSVLEASNLHSNTSSENLAKRLAPRFIAVDVSAVSIHFAVGTRANQSDGKSTFSAADIGSKRTSTERTNNSALIRRGDIHGISDGAIAARVFKSFELNDSSDRLGM